MNIEFRWYEIDEDYDELPLEAVQRADGRYQVLQERHQEGPEGEDWWGEWETI